MKNAMVEHLKDCANVEGSFFSVTPDLAIDLGLSSLDGVLRGQRRGGSIDNDVETDRASRAQVEHVFFTITKWNPGDWHTIAISAAAGAKLTKAG
jgi:hypothetical protein